ncbi:MAG: redoxin domain-containing protein [Clostridia bacterium]|nr:redoxin domain-containing protein [Clostridia bacterium]
MRRFIAMLLAALMLLSGVSALAGSETFYEEMGFALDMDDIQGQAQNCVALQRYGVLMHAPFAAMMIVMYYALPVETVRSVEAEIAKAEDDAEKAMLTNRLQMMGDGVGAIIVTNAGSLADIGIEWPLPEGYGVTEFGAAGDYRWYYISSPTDALLDAVDEVAEAGEMEIDPEATKQAVLADAEMIRAGMLKKLNAAQLSEPVDNDTGHVGEVLSFETTDLDGNPVSSADLFKDNKITMVNLWGTWCVNCMDEMADLAALHTRLQAKGCGVVGVEYEGQPIEGAVADKAREVMAQYGTNYPNVVIPEDHPIFGEVTGYPTSFFVDSDGRILTFPIAGAAVELYEPTVDKLLVGESAEAVPEALPEAEATANDSGAYRVIVRDADGNPVKGVVVQLCDDTTCALQKTKADGVATFETEAQKVYEVHVLKAPEGYAATDAVYKTLDTFSDVNITLDKAG